MEAMGAYRGESWNDRGQNIVARRWMTEYPRYYRKVLTML